MPRNYKKVETKKKCGRKPNSYEEEMVSFSIYVRRHKVEELGGKIRVRRLIYSNLNKET